MLQENVFPILREHLVACCCLHWFLKCISQILKLHFSVVARRISHKNCSSQMLQENVFPILWEHLVACCCLHWLITKVLQSNKAEAEGAISVGKWFKLWIILHWEEKNQTPESSLIAIWSLPRSSCCFYLNQQKATHSWECPLKTVAVEPQWFLNLSRF